MKLVKNGSDLVMPNDEVLIELVVTRSGTQLKSPLPPNEVCKVLFNLITELLFSSFQKAEVSKIQPPV